MDLLVVDDSKEGGPEVIPAGEGGLVLGRHQSDDAFAFEILVALHEGLHRLLQLGVEGLTCCAGIHFGNCSANGGDPGGVFAARGDIGREVAGDEGHAQRRVLAGGALQLEQGAVLGVAVGLRAFAGFFSILAQ